MSPADFGDSRSPRGLRAGRIRGLVTALVEGKRVALEGKGEIRIVSEGRSLRGTASLKARSSS